MGPRSPSTCWGMMQLHSYSNQFVPVYEAEELADVFSLQTRNLGLIGQGTVKLEHIPVSWPMIHHHSNGGILENTKNHSQESSQFWGFTDHNWNGSGQLSSTFTFQSPEGDIIIKIGHVHLSYYSLLLSTVDHAFQVKMKTWTSNKMKQKCLHTQKCKQSFSTTFC